MNNDCPFSQSLSCGAVALACLHGQAGAAYGDISALSGVISQVLHAGQAMPAGPASDNNLDLRGKSVLVKPNWVTHENVGGHGSECLVTHPDFVLAVLGAVFSAGPAKVTVGDAPIQMCHFDKVVTSEWRAKVLDIATCPVEFADFRRTILTPGGFDSTPQRDARSLDRYILFDLGEDSLLEPVSAGHGSFRITCYDPGMLAEHHRPGRHRYLLCREAFEADVIINLPKLKTHKKAGVTAALKNLVGLNGNKEYLPHHRVGGAWTGGDCYPGLAPLKRLAEYCIDQANRRIGSPSYRQWERRFRRLLQIHSLVGSPEIEGGWYGNDTVWRMTLDLNRLLFYGRLDGTLAEHPQRLIYSLTDAVVAGEGNGPLAPSPVALGMVSFSCSSPFADLVHATLMGYDWRKIPLVAEAFKRFRYPLTLLSPEQCRVYCDGNNYSLAEVASIGRLFRPPSGWEGHIEAGDVPE